MMQHFIYEKKKEVRMPRVVSPIKLSVGGRRLFLSFLSLSACCARILKHYDSETYGVTVFSVQLFNL